MNRLIKASEVMTLPVVTIDGGEDVAEVKDVIYGSEQGRLLGFTLNKRGFLRGKMKAVLPASSVTAVGPAAVMIRNADDCLVSKSDAPDPVSSPDKNRNVLGNEVITEGGTKLGTVSDLIMLLGGDGEVVGYELRREESTSTWFIPRPAQLALSGAALVVPTASSATSATTSPVSALPSSGSAPSTEVGHDLLQRSHRTPRGQSRRRRGPR